MILLNLFQHWKKNFLKSIHKLGLSQFYKAVSLVDKLFSDLKGSEKSEDDENEYNKETLNAVFYIKLGL